MIIILIVFVLVILPIATLTKQVPTLEHTNKERSSNYDVAGLTALVMRIMVIGDVSGTSGTLAAQCPPTLVPYMLPRVSLEYALCKQSLPCVRRSESARIGIDRSHHVLFGLECQRCF
jgi:hypothetical protein